MRKLTPLVKGLITGTTIVVLLSIVALTKQTPSDKWSYITFAIYAAGVLWTLFDFAKSPEYKRSFGAIFGQGFRCFVVVTLIMVVFTGVYNKMHPEIAAESAELYRADLVKQKNKTPAEIDSEVGDYKKGFTTAVVSQAIFGYLILGVFFTAAGAGLILMRRN